MEDKKILLDNIDKIHTTEMGIDRIKRNLKIGGCKKSCVYGEIIFPDMNQICKNLLSDIATFMLSNFFSDNSIANPLHLIHVF